VFVVEGAVAEASVEDADVTEGSERDQVRRARWPVVDDGADRGRLLELIGASWTTQVIRTSVELGVVDELADGPRSVSDVAAVLQVDPGALGRLVRALCSIELCEEVDDGSFVATATGRLLARGEGSLGSWATWWGGPAWEEWGRLADAVRTGRPVRDGDGFSHRSPELAGRFDDAMAALTAIDAARLAAALQLRGDERVADVGGGRGTLLRAVLERHPDARGLVVDLPSAVAGARGHIEAWGLADRLDVTAVDAFDAVPSGADAYVLKSVLHDWDDEAAHRILERCRDAAVARGGRILVIERLAPDRAVATDLARSTARMDLHMLVAQGGRERTEAELRAVLADAGLVVVDVRPATPTLAVIEARVAPAGGAGADGGEGGSGGAAQAG